MCSLTIDCRCDTCIDGMTRYQWPRIIAVQAPPSSAAELRKLATVSACAVVGRQSRRCRKGLRHDRDEPRRAADGDDRRTDRREGPADRRPVEDDAPLRRQQRRERDPRRSSPTSARPDETRTPTAIRIAASPALKRKNFTPASRETSSEREDDPEAEMGEEEEEDHGVWGWKVGRGGMGGKQESES